MANIYELTSDFLKVQELIQSGEYEEETLLNTLECLDYEIEVKADAYAKIMQNMKSDITGLKAEEEEIIKKKKSSGKRY